MFRTSVLNLLLNYFTIEIGYKYIIILCTGYYFHNANGPWQSTTSRRVLSVVAAVYFTQNIYILVNIECRTRPHESSKLTENGTHKRAWKHTHIIPRVNKNLRKRRRFWLIIYCWKYSRKSKPQPSFTCDHNRVFRQLGTSPLAAWWMGSSSRPHVRPRGTQSTPKKDPSILHCLAVPEWAGIILPLHICVCK